MSTPGVVAPIVSILAIYLFRMAELKAKRQTIPGQVRENLTLKLFVLSGTLLLVGGIAEFLWKRGSLEWITFIAGWACGLGSFVLRRRAIAALGQFWSLHVEIRENHQFVQSGPFRWVRHPTYFSMLLEILSGGLLLNSWITLTVVTLLFVPTLWFRVRMEEAALVEKFGPAYQAYQQRVPVLIPYRIPPC